MNNNSGKVITIFVIITAILLVSLTAISLFFFQQELSKRKFVEDSLQQSNDRLASLEGQITETKQQKFLLEEKNKELDERVNSLLDELELEQGLKDEMKREQVALNDQLEKETKAKDKLKEELNKQIEEAKTRIKQLEDKLRAEIEVSYKLKERNSLLEKENTELAQGMGLDNYVPAGGKTSEEGGKDKVQGEMNLDEIVVQDQDKEPEIVAKPAKIPHGRVVSVDEDTEFVIIDLGKKHGITLGRMLSIYRGDDYLGDIKITRVQPEMSAADLILPLTGKLIRKNDQVIAK